MSNDTASSADYSLADPEPTEPYTDQNLYPPDQASTLGGHYYYTELELDR